MTSKSAFIPLKTLQESVVLPAKTSEMRVALVCMPWGSIYKPSPAMGILKRVIANSDFTPELHYLNLAFASQIGLKTYENIASGASLHQEWFFSQCLFGEAGTGELHNSWEQMLSLEEGPRFLRRMASYSQDDSELFKTLAETQIPRFLDFAFQHVDWPRYTVVGFTTTFAQSLASLALAKRIKDVYPRINIVFGGANVDSEMGNEFVRAFPWIDYSVHGEAEYTLPQLLSAISRNEKTICIPGISSRIGDQIYNGHVQATTPVNMEDSPAPDYSDYISALEVNGLKNTFKLQLFYEGSRGCWWGEKHHCTFCGLNGETMSFRQKTSARVLEEIIAISKAYSCLSLSATDNILSNNSWKTFLPQLASLDLDIRLFYEVKANLSYSQLVALRSAGVCEIQPGIESFSSRILTLMDKGVTGIQNIQLLKWCYELGIRPIWNFLYGFPGETDDDYAGMPELIRSISHLYPPTDMLQVMFERFSPYHFNSTTYGLNLQPSSEYSHIFPKTRVNLKRIAYFFEDSNPQRSKENQERIGATSTEVDGWKQSWTHQNRYLFYEKGPDFMLLYDNRPTSFNGTQESRLLRLGHQLSELYNFCHTIRSKRSIFEKFGDFQDNSASRNRALDKVLKSLVDQGFMHVESERYLSLAVRRSARRFWPDNY